MVFQRFWILFIVSIGYDYLALFDLSLSQAAFIFSLCNNDE
jgi:hypothetical protein